MKVRRFNIGKNGAVMVQDGEFLHINDIMLLLKEERASISSCIEIKKESNDDFSVKQKYGYMRQVDIIDYLIEKIRRQD